MRRQRNQYSSFKQRLQSRRVFEAPERRDSRRTLTYRVAMAGVMARIG